MTGQPLTLALQASIEVPLARLRAGRGELCLSEYTFSNLYLFRAVHDYRYIEGEWPGISGLSYDGARHFMPLFDPIDAPDGVLHRLLADHDHLYPIDERRAYALASGRFKVTHSRDDADYLYSASTFADFPGRALGRKRNQLRQFEARCKSTAEPYTPSLEGAARQVLADWMSQKGKASGEADEPACLEAFALASEFGLEGFVHFADGRPIGVVLGQMLEPGVYAIRFAKGLDWIGLYPHMFRHFCTAFDRHFGRDVRWLNFEQDMGIAGFRRSKMSYEPFALLPKYRLAPLARR